MKRLLIHSKTTIVSIFTLLFLFGFTLKSYAHCDRVNGPVAVDARKALETGDFNYASIWIGEEQEQELRSAFNQSLKVYKNGGESRELAERYFISTTVRLHREAEGMPFTGLKSAEPASNDIQIAEKALQSGNLKPVTDLLAEEIQKKTSELFNEAQKAKQRKDQSVEAGREWVDAYVRYIVYIHKLYQSIQAGPAHGVGNN
ncbi:MAG: DUF6448 family protein [Gracilimonas sp.]